MGARRFLGLPGLGARQRYRLLDSGTVVLAVGDRAPGGGQKDLAVTLEEMIAQDELKRQPCWTESLAVGRPSYLEQIKPMIFSRQETEIVEEAPDLWILKDAEIPYGQNLSGKMKPNPLKLG